MVATTGLRKRRASSSEVLEGKTHRHHGSSKKPKLYHPLIPPPSFWDSLSAVPLTYNALRELDRRYSKALPDLSLQKHPCQLQHGSLQQFAMHGGPNLTHLRDVCQKEKRKKPWI